MCLRRTNLDGKTRLLYAAGNLSLVTEASLSQFGLRWGVHHQVLFDGLRGFFVGFSLTLLLWVVRRKSLRAQPRDGDA